MLDALRGLACVMVILCHCKEGLEPDGSRLGNALLGILTRFAIGVPVFFVISGYCISASSDSTRRRAHGALTYFARRFRRIFPPYWFAFGITALIFVVAERAGHGGLGQFYFGTLHQPSAMTGWSWIQNLTLTQTWLHRLVGGQDALVIGSAWTLCYEEQFYAVCGLLLVVSPGRFFQGVLWITLAVVVVVAAVGMQPLRGFFFDGRWIYFSAGVLVYYLINYASGAARRWVTWAAIGVAGAGLLARNAPALHVRTELASLLMIGAVLAVALLFVHRFDERLATSSWLRPLTLCGRMCYSLYLIQEIVTRVTTYGVEAAGVHGVVPALALTIPIGTAGSIGLGWLFYQLVERHFLNTGTLTKRLPGSPPFTHPQPAPVSAVSSGVPLATELGADRLPAPALPASGVVAAYAGADVVVQR